jgi:N-ethylmaleimide reductase
LKNILFESIEIGPMKLKNRMVMAPMTRNRASKEGTVTPMMIKHYGQRASAGLIISESIPVSAQGVGYPNTPGLFSDEQVRSWKLLCNEVHVRGGKIFAQLQHCGRISHPSMLPENAIPVAPSALRPVGNAVTYSGFQEFVYPREITKKEIENVIEQFGNAAKRAFESGFDGVEIHGANGYLIDQFLRDSTNVRDDEYGGMIKNRYRLLWEVIQAVSNIFATSQIGVRLSPENSFNDIHDSEPETHFRFVIEELSKLKLAYVHVLEGDMMTGERQVDYRVLRKNYNGIYMANNGYDFEKATMSLNSGDADLISFGLPFLANPDLPKRFELGLELNKVDQDTFYGGGDKGYTDYPFANETI